MAILHNLGIETEAVHHNARPGTLYDEALRYEKGSAILSTGALAAFSGAKTGRSPLDKRVVMEPTTKDDVWWGTVNLPLSENSFKINRERAIDYLNTRPRLYVLDGFAGWDPEFRYKIRIITSRAYHALFMHNMLIRPTAEELANFGTPDYTIYNAGAFPCNRATEGMGSGTSVSLNFASREVVILGTQYAGEMKKGVFTIMNYLLPKRGILSMHASANEGKDGDVTIFFGLSGTGKTTLSADENRMLIGDDEHAWTSKGIFNIEGGCYAKAIGLTREKEPEIWDAIRFGSLLENVVFDQRTGQVDYDDGSITEHTSVVSLGVHSQCEAPGGWWTPKKYYHAHMRCIRRAATGLHADTFPSHVPLHFRLHSKGGWYRGWCDRAHCHILSMLRCTIYGMAPGQIRRIAGRKDGEAQRECLAHQYGMDWWCFRRRPPHELEGHTGHH